METQHQKWVNLSYLVFAALIAYVISAAATQVSAVLDLETRIRSIDMVIRIGTLVLGGLIFLFLYKNEKTNTFMNEVVSELERVTWPTQKETVSATIVVIIMVLISGMVLGFMDFAWTKLLQMIIL
jgi:preprotein translocase subunit SecE